MYSFINQIKNIVYIIVNKGYLKIHARNEFGAISSCSYKTQYCMTADSLGLLKIKRYKTKQRIFIVQQK